MNDFSPYERLGVEESASFEEIQTAKQNLLQKYEGDSQVLETIEIAYDAIIMERLRLRQEGKIKVPEQIRFPEKTVEVKKPSISLNNSSLPNKSPMWLQNLLDHPSLKEIGVSGLVFFVLILLSVFSQDSQILPLLLTFGVGTTFFFVYRKGKLFWRSVGISFFGFVLGITLSSILGNLLISSGLSLSFTIDQFVSLFTFCLLWLCANFIR